MDEEHDNDDEQSPHHCASRKRPPPSSAGSHVHTSLNYEQLFAELDDEIEEESELPTSSRDSGVFDDEKVSEEDYKKSFMEETHDAFVLDYSDDEFLGGDTDITTVTMDDTSDDGDDDGARPLCAEAEGKKKIYRPRPSKAKKPRFLPYNSDKRHLRDKAPAGVNPLRPRTQERLLDEDKISNVLRVACCSGQCLRKTTYQDVLSARQHTAGLDWPGYRNFIFSSIDKASDFHRRILGVAESDRSVRPEFSHPTTGDRICLVAWLRIHGVGTTAYYNVLSSYKQGLQALDTDHQSKDTAKKSTMGDFVRFFLSRWINDNSDVCNVQHFSRVLHFRY